MYKMQAKRNGTSAYGNPIKKGDTIFWDSYGKKAYLPGEDIPSVSDSFTFGDKTFYRNKKGRCEDAPCCGCCTI